MPDQREREKPSPSLSCRTGRIFVTKRSGGEISFYISVQFCVANNEVADACHGWVGIRQREGSIGMMGDRGKREEGGGGNFLVESAGVLSITITLSAISPDQSRWSAPLYKPLSGYIDLNYTHHYIPPAPETTTGEI